MAGIDATIIQNLLEQIEALKDSLRSGGKKKCKRLKKINLEDKLKRIPRAADGRVDASAWSTLSSEEQRESHFKLDCALGALNAAVAEQPWGYGAALIATLVFLPAAATLFTLIMVLVDWHCKSFPAPVCGTLAALAAWIISGLVCRGLADARHAIPSSYEELVPRLTGLEEGLKGICPTIKNSCEGTAYLEALKEKNEIRKDLSTKGLTWPLGFGYAKVWSRVYRAEEAMIDIAPLETVLECAYYDEARLLGSSIDNRDDSLDRLRKAVASLDPGSQKYFKSAPTSTTVPSTVSIGITTLPDGTVATHYSKSLSVVGGTPHYGWAVVGGAIPDGLILSSDGILRGTPTNEGHGGFTVRVTDKTGAAGEAHFDLVINQTTQTSQSPLTIDTTTPLPTGAVGVRYAERLFAVGGKPPYKWKMEESGLEELHSIGLQWDDVAGLISGIPVREATLKLTARVTDKSTPNSADPIYLKERQFTLSIAPCGANTIVTKRDRMDRAVLRYVRQSINDYRNARWIGLILLRNRTLATFMLTGAVIFALLAIAIMYEADKAAIVSATVFYLVGATAGLCSRIRGESTAETAAADYGLSAARLITIPLFSGLAALGGLLFISYLQPLAPGLGTQEKPSPPKAEQQAQAIVGESKDGISGNPVAPKTEQKATVQGKPTVQPATKAEKIAAKKSTAKGTMQKGDMPKKDTDRETTKKEDNLPSGGTAEQKDGKGSEKNNVKGKQALKDIFDLNNNLIGIFIAAVFGFAPGVLFDRLQRQADRYKADLKSSRSSEGSQKT